MTTERAPGARPRFSVVMNVYNGSAWLEQTLVSLFAQTFTDWELIFFDDRSTDDSPALLDPYRADPRVRYVLAQQQVPLGQARAQAVALAHGEWLAFLDQDDLWTPDKLALQAQVIDCWHGPELAIVYGRAMKFGAPRVPHDFDHWHEFGDLPQGDIFEALFIDSCFICQSAVCLRTDLAQALGDMPAEHRFCPDYYYYTQLASRYATACTQQVVCWYRVHALAMSRERYAEVLQEMLLIAQCWRHRLSPATYERRCRIQHTMLALRELATPGLRQEGWRHLWQQGSWPYLLSRPFARTWRELRRAWRRGTGPAPQVPTFTLQAPAAQGPR
jgi:glycosyltransferase involved in cell wall biosynthesis